MNNMLAAQLPMMMLIKDSDLLFRGMTDPLAQSFGWKSAACAIGNDDRDIPCAVSELAGEIRRLDKKILTENKKLITLDIHHYSDTWRLMLIKRQPFKKDGKQSYLHAVGMDVTDVGFFKSFVLSNFCEQKKNVSLQQGMYFFDSNENKFSLTRTEEICLFYLLRGKMNKDISIILNRSRRTIEDHVDRIKMKFNCETRSQLISKAICEGFLYHIPESLLYNLSGFMDY